MIQPWLQHSEASMGNLFINLLPAFSSAKAAVPLYGLGWKNSLLNPLKIKWAVYYAKAYSKWNDLTRKNKWISQSQTDMEAALYQVRLLDYEAKCCIIWLGEDILGSYRDFSPILVPELNSKLLCKEVFYRWTVLLINWIEELIKLLVDQPYGKERRKKF